ncbi:dermonecrotic toxin domain-containing protein [Pseudomonas cyclaminis]|uniref:dermonecrotic toxin domain-containing protein n=1 Tax=Pseudomonas cyclaminis TaxID=2781239 RepID=UPI001881103D|nr:DUF6543 domain-containing protein [Pseudomonas cyclaminis]MBE8603368.1 hypothetical protein [Pseudomonas cyclaminis]
MTVSAATATTRPISAAPTNANSWDDPKDTYVIKNTRGKFNENLVKDLNSGKMTPDVNKIVEAVLSPGKAGLPKVQVKTFAVDGVQAKDIIFIQRVPPVLDGPNIVLYVPEKDGSSYQSFKTVEDMNAWLKIQANDTTSLKAFTRHFAQDSAPEKQGRVADTLIRFRSNDINAVVGPYANEGGDIFGRLDKEPSAPSAAVNGLTNLKEEHTSPEGRVLYSGLRPGGTKVFFEYDAYGNFQGEDKKGNFYFVKNGLNSPKPLVPMTESAFKQKVRNEALNNVGANDTRGLYEELLKHLEHPSAGIADALQAFGVNKNTADTVERYLDNPFSALLVDLNTNNQIGKVLGVDKQTMDSALKGAGDFAQGFVPYYGQARGLGSLLAKAIRNEPLSVEETRDLADNLALKPDSPALKNLPAPHTPGKPSLPALREPVESPAPEVKAKEAPPIEEPVAAVNHPGFKKVSFEGEEKYFVAETPDAGDGEHYLLRVEAPDDPTKLVSSSKVAKPDENGVWRRRGVSGGSVKAEVLNRIRNPLTPVLDEIAITDIPTTNANGVTQYQHDANHLAVMKRRDVLRKEFGLDNYGAVRSEVFQTKLARQVGTDRDANGKLYGQCAELAAYAAEKVKGVAKEQGYRTYMVQIPETNHTVVLLSKNSYRAGERVDWGREFKSDSITVDLWEGVLSKNNPGAADVLINASKKHGYTKGKPPASIQVEMKAH